MNLKNVHSLAIYETSEHQVQMNTLALCAQLGEPADRRDGYIPKTRDAYKQLPSKVGNEYHILTEATPERIESASSDSVTEVVCLMRERRAMISFRYGGQ